MPFPGSHWDLNQALHALKAAEGSADSVAERTPDLVVHSMFPMCGDVVSTNLLTHVLFFSFPRPLRLSYHMPTFRMSTFFTSTPHSHLLL